jgi:hypothetical protein
MADATIRKTVCMKNLLLLFSCLLALAVACGGDDSGSGDQNDGAESAPASELANEEEADYLRGQAQRMATFAAEATALNDTATSAFDPANSAEQRQADGLAYAVAYEEFTRRRLASLSESTPPESLKSPHDDLILAATDAVTLAEAQRQRLEAEAISDSAAFAAIYAELNGLEVTQLYRDACAALVRRAVQLQVTVDFSCT